MTAVAAHNFADLWALEDAVLHPASDKLGIEWATDAANVLAANVVERRMRPSPRPGVEAGGRGCSAKQLDLADAFWTGRHRIYAAAGANRSGKTVATWGLSFCRFLKYRAKPGQLFWCVAPDFTKLKQGPHRWLWEYLPRAMFRDRVYIEANGFGVNPIMSLALPGGGHCTIVFKCLGPDTLIDSPDGLPRRVSSIRGRHRVWAWNGYERVPVLAEEPFVKGRQACYRVKLATGESFDCSVGHRVLTPYGYCEIGQLLKSSLASLACVSTPAAGDCDAPCAPPWSAEPGSRCDYLGDLRSCDALLRQAANIAQDAVRPPIGVPSLDDGVGRRQPVDGAGHTPRHIPANPQSDPQPTWDSLAGSGALVELCRLPDISDPRMPACNRQDWQLPAGSSYPPPQADELCQSAIDVLFPWLALVSPDGGHTRIVGFEYIGIQPIYDFHVPRYHNYVTAGVIHHNTEEQDLKSFESDSVTGIAWTEATRETLFDAMLARLVDTRGWMLLDFVPTEAWHKFRLRLEAAKTGSMIGYWRFAMADNAHNLPVNAIAEARSQMSARDAKVRIDGEEGSEFGVVYREFDPVRHVITPFLIPKDWPRWRTLDYGYRNPTACLWCVMAPAGCRLPGLSVTQDDDTLIVYRELYETEKTVPQLAGMIRDLSADETYRHGNRVTVDPTIFNRNQADGRTIAQHFEAAGVKCRKGKRSAAVGEHSMVAKVRLWFEKGRILFFRSCVNAIREHEMWRYRENADGEAPGHEPFEDKNNHTCDALRELVAENLTFHEPSGGVEYAGDLEAA